MDLYIRNSKPIGNFTPVTFITNFLYTPPPFQWKSLDQSDPPWLHGFVKDHVHMTRLTNLLERQLQIVLILHVSLAIFLQNDYKMYIDTRYSYELLRFVRIYIWCVIDSDYLTN